MSDEMSWEEACAILVVEPTASQKEIRDQYYYWAQLLHPDKNQNKPESVRKKAEDQLKKINNAYSILKEPNNNPYINPPKLNINVTHIRFNDMEVGQTKHTSFEVRSIGGQYTKFSIDPPKASWLHVTTVKSLTEKQFPLVVTIETTGTGLAGEKFSCNLITRLENEQTGLKDEVIIKTELWMKAKPAILDLDINKITFDYARPNLYQSGTFKIRNSGHNLLQGHLSTTKAWLTVSPTTVYIPASSEYTYYVNAPVISVPYQFVDDCYIHIITNCGDHSIPVHLSVIKEPINRGRQETTQDFSFSDIWDKFWPFVVYPIIPPIFLVPWGLYTWLDGMGAAFIFWLLVVFYLAIGISIAAFKCSKVTPKQIVIPEPPPPTVQYGQAPSQYRQPPSQYGQTSSQSSRMVVGNKLRAIYHRSSCRWAAKMARQNRESLTIDEAKRRGYRRCRECRP